MTLTNEGADQFVEKIATDQVGNTATTAVWVSIDRTPPTVTGSPGEGEIVSSLRPPLVIEFDDELSGVAPGTLQVTLDGTNVTAHFETFPAGAVWVPTNDLAVGPHTWEVSVGDAAGHGDGGCGRSGAWATAVGGGVDERSTTNAFGVDGRSDRGNDQMKHWPRQWCAVGMSWGVGEGCGLCARGPVTALLPSPLPSETSCQCLLTAPPIRS